MADNKPKNKSGNPRDVDLSYIDKLRKNSQSISQTFVKKKERELLAKGIQDTTINQGDLGFEGATTDFQEPPTNAIKKVKPRVKLNPVIPDAPDFVQPEAERQSYWDEVKDFATHTAKDVGNVFKLMNNGFQNNWLQDDKPVETTLEGMNSMKNLLFLPFGVADEIIRSNSEGRTVSDAIRGVFESLSWLDRTKFNTVMKIADKQGLTRFVRDKTGMDEDTMNHLRNKYNDFQEEVTPLLLPLLHSALKGGKKPFNRPNIDNQLPPTNPPQLGKGQPPQLPEHFPLQIEENAQPFSKEKIIRDLEYEYNKERLSYELDALDATDRLKKLKVLDDLHNKINELKGIVPDEVKSETKPKTAIQKVEPKEVEAEEVEPNIKSIYDIKPSDKETDLFGYKFNLSGLTKSKGEYSPIGKLEAMEFIRGLNPDMPKEFYQAYLKGIEEVAKTYTPEEIKQNTILSGLTKEDLKEIKLKANEIEELKGEDNNDNNIVKNAKIETVPENDYYGLLEKEKTRNSVQVAVLQDGKVYTLPQNKATEHFQIYDNYNLKFGKSKTGFFIPETNTFYLQDAPFDRVRSVSDRDKFMREEIETNENHADRDMSDEEYYRSQNNEIDNLTNEEFGKSKEDEINALKESNDIENKAQIKPVVEQTDTKPIQSIPKENKPLKSDLNAKSKKEIKLAIQLKNGEVISSDARTHNQIIERNNINPDDVESTGLIDKKGNYETKADNRVFFERRLILENLRLAKQAGHLKDFIPDHYEKLSLINLKELEQKLRLETPYARTIDDVKPAKNIKSKERFEKASIEHIEQLENELYENRKKFIDAKGKERMDINENMNSIKDRIKSLKDRLQNPNKLDNAVTNGLDLGKAKKYFEEKIAPMFRSRGKFPEDIFREFRLLRQNQGANNKAIDYMQKDFDNAFKKEYGKLPKDKQSLVKQHIYNSLIGEDSFDWLKPETKKQALGFRKTIDAMGEALQSNQFISKATKEAIETHKGSYVPRFYMRDIEPKKWSDYIKNSTEGIQIMNNAKATVADYFFKNKHLNPDEPYSDWYKQFYDEKTGKVKNPDELEGILNSMLDAHTDPVKFEFGNKKPGSADRSNFKTRKEIPDVFRQLMGEVTDPSDVSVRGIFKISNIIENIKFLSNIRDIGFNKVFYSEKTSNDLGDFTTKLADADNPTFRALTRGKDIYTSKEIAEAFNDAFNPKETNKLVKFFFKMSGLINSGKTAFAPITTARNMGTNIFLMTANGNLNFHVLPEAFRIVSGKNRKEKLELMRLGVIGESVTGGDLAFYSDEVMGKHPTSKVADKIKTGYGKVIQFYSHIDDVARVVAFKNELAKLEDVYTTELKNGTLTEQDIKQITAYKVNQTQPNYSLLYPIAKSLRRTPLGNFPSWSAEILRIIPNIIKLSHEEMNSKNPKIKDIGRKRLASFIGTLGIISAIPFVSRELTDTSNEQEDALRDIMPEWQQNSQFVHLGHDKEHGYRLIDASYSDPFNYAKKIIMPLILNLPKGEIMEGMKGTLEEFFKPFLDTKILAKTIRDASTGINSDNGDKIWYDTDSSAEKWGKILAFAMTKVEPGIVTTGRRIIKSFGEQTGEYSKLHPVNELASLSGWRVTTINPTTPLYFKSVALANNLNQLKSDYSEEVIKNPDDKEKLTEYYTNKMQEQYDIFRNYIKDFKTLNLTDDQIKAGMEQGRVSKANIEAILKDEAPDLEPKENKKRKKSALKKKEELQERLKGN